MDMGELVPGAAAGAGAAAVAVPTSKVSMTGAAAHVPGGLLPGITAQSEEAS